MLERTERAVVLGRYASDFKQSLMVCIYIYGGCPIFLFIETAILREKTLTFAKRSRTLCFSFAGVHHVMKPFNLVGTRFPNTSARSVFGSAGGCYRQERGVGAEFRWHMLLEKAFAQGRWMMKFVGLLWATGFLWSRFIRRNLLQTFRETLAKKKPVLWRFLRHT